MNEVPGTIKDALHNTIHRHDSLTVEAIAEQLNMTPSYLYRAALPDPDTDGPNASGVRFPLKQLVPLIKVTGDYQVLDTIEQLLGRVAVPVALNSSVTIKELQVSAINAASEFGEVMKEINDSIKDNKITDDERERIEKESWQAIQAIMQVIMSCRQR